MKSYGVMITCDMCGRHFMATSTSRNDLDRLKKDAEAQTWADGWRESEGKHTCPGCIKERVRREWQPMSTAPKDHEILLNTKSGGEYEAFWDYDRWLTPRGNEQREHIGYMSVLPISWRENTQKSVGTATGTNTEDFTLAKEK